MTIAIVLTMTWLLVHCPVDFDDQFHFSTVEVDDVPHNRMLTPEMESFDLPVTQAPPQNILRQRGMLSAYTVHALSCLGIAYDW